MSQSADGLHLTPRGEIARVLGATLEGLHGRRVRVEVDVAPALPGFSLVGLASTALRESRERIGAALRHAGFRWPEGRVTVNLAPADLRKDGAALDFPIALGVLLASGQIPRPCPQLLRSTLFVGEVTLDGALRCPRGLLALTLDARRLGFERVACPPQSSATTRWSSVTPLEFVHLRDLRTLPQRLAMESRTVVGSDRAKLPRTQASRVLAPIRGQVRAKRTLLVAAAGRHHLYLQGPPGCGKTMMARALGQLLAPLGEQESLDQVRIRSCMGLPPSEAPHSAPLRAPHHSVSSAGLVGGGRPPQPGEITLAHGGLLFLDEMPEFGPKRLERLREVLESGQILHARLGQSVRFPARFQLVGAGNACPCGWHGSREDRCRCTAPQVQRYLGRLSGPLRDRIDLWVDVDREPASELWSTSGCEIEDADFLRARDDPQSQRLDLDEEARRLVESRADRMGLSPRAVKSVLRVAATLAALSAKDRVGRIHVAEALSYRPAF